MDLSIHTTIEVLATATSLASPPPFSKPSLQQLPLNHILVFISLIKSTDHLNRAPMHGKVQRALSACRAGLPDADYRYRRTSEDVVSM